MVSIIRSPEISDQKRKLASRVAAPKATMPVEAAIASAVRLATPASGADFSQTAIAQEVKRQVEQARLSMQAEVKAQAEMVCEQARQKGLEEGRQAGVEQAKQKGAAELARLHALAQQLHFALESGIRGMEEIAVSMAFEAVCKVLGDAVPTKEGVQALVRQAATHAINTEQLVVRLHAGDLAALREAGALDGAIPSVASVSWVADNAVALGGCVLETDGGELDARLETQLDRLRSALLAAR